MKIEAVQSMLLSGAHFVRIRADDGTVGLGQSGHWAYPESSHSIVDEHFGRYLVGRDPMRIERHWQHLYRMAPFRGSSLSAAVSAIDIALWDLKGKVLGVPIWEMLGGRYRDRIRLMPIVRGNDVDALVSNAINAVAEGFTALKIAPIPTNHFDLSMPRLIHEATERVAAVREVAGLDVDLALEFSRRLTPSTALQVIEPLLRFSPLFVEDPVQIDSISSQASIARRVPVTMAEGERLHTVWEFRELLEQGGSQYLRPDLGLAGGISGCKKIAAIAESYHAAVVTHNFVGPVLTSAALHLDACMPNFVVQEYSLESDEGPKAAGFTTSHRRVGGYMIPPENAGLGIEVDFDAVAADLRPNAVPVHEMPMPRDGGVAKAN